MGPALTLVVIGFVGVPVAMGIAILRYRLYDIDIVINRTLVYGALTASVAGIYVMAVGALKVLFQSSGTLLNSLVGTGVVAIVFAPLRDHLQRAVNRLMYGERDDPYAVISRLGQRLEATLEPRAMLPTIGTYAIGTYGVEGESCGRCHGSKPWLQPHGRLLGGYGQ